MNKWKINYYNDSVIEWLNELPVGIRADYVRVTELLLEFGLDLRMPHSKAIGKGLFELRLKGKEGIGRVFYCMLVRKQIIILHGFIKKTQQTPEKDLKIALDRMKKVKNEYKQKEAAS